MRYLARIQEYFVPVSLAMNPEGLRRGRILVNAALFLVAYALLFLCLFYISGHAFGTLISGSTALLTLALLWYYRAQGDVRMMGHSFVLILGGFSWAFILLLGGVNSPQMAWFLALPLTAFLIIGQNAGYGWTLITVIGLFVFFFFGPQKELMLALDAGAAEPLHFIGLSGLVLYILMIVDVYEKGRVAAMTQLDNIQRKIMAKSLMLEEQKRAIKSQNQAIFEQNNALEKQYQEIVNINNSLERIIHDRTFKLKEALHDLDTFLYESSHALRRPVSSILGLLQVIRMENNPDVQVELTLRLEDTVRGMDNMLQKLIFINTIGQPYDFNESIDFKEMLDQITNKHRSLIDERKMKIDAQLGVNHMVSSTHLIFVMLDNLLENAFLYSDATGRRRPYVELKVKEQDRHVSITVSDNGIGIPSECKERIFDLFYRASMLSTGNGLGLYMVKKVVERLEGTITMKTEERRFTTFEIMLPLHLTAKKKPSSQVIQLQPDSEGA